MNTEPITEQVIRAWGRGFLWGGVCFSALFIFAGICAMRDPNSDPQYGPQVPLSAYRESSPLDDMTPGDVILLVGKQGETVHSFHLMPRRGRASIPTPVPVKAKLAEIDEGERTPIHALILEGPSKGMDVDVTIEEVKRLSGAGRIGD